MTKVIEVTTITSIKLDKKNNLTLKPQRRRSSDNELTIFKGR